MTSPPGRDEDNSPDAFAAALREAVSGARAIPGPVTVVVPTRYAATRVGRLLAESGMAPAPPDLTPGEGDGERPVAVLTPEELVRELGSPSSAVRRERPAPACVHRAASATAAREGERWLAGLAELPGGPVAVHDAVREMRRATADTIAALGRRSGRVGDVARLTMRAGALLRAHGFADPVDVDSAAADAAADGGRGALGMLVVVDEGPLRPAARRVLGRLSDGASPGGGAVPAPVHHVRGAGRVPLLTEVRTCPDADEEGRAAVRAVMDGVDRGVALGDMAVFHPPGSPYAPIIRQHLAAAGVDTAGPPTEGLARTVAGRGLLGLLALADSDWGRSEVMGWMTSFPLAETPGGAPVPASTWDALSAHAGVARGGAQWQARLGLYQGSIERSPNDAAGSRGDGAATMAARLAMFMAELVTLAAPPTGGWAAHAQWAAALLDRYLSPGPRWPRRHADAARHVRASVLSLGELDLFGPAPDLPAFRHAVSDALDADVDVGGNVDVGVDVDLVVPDAGRASVEGLLVAPFAWARGLRLDTAVLVGLGEDSVAGASTPPGPWREEERLVDASGALRTEVHRRHDLRQALVAALRAGHARRIGTVPAVDRRTGVTVTASPWLAELMGLRTRQRTTMSFASGVASASTPADRSELELRDTMRWVARHGDVAGAPLVRRSARLAAAVAATRARRSTTFTRFDGGLAPGTVRATDADSPVSPTRLETYVACPRRFLFDRVLGARRRPDPERTWQIEAAARGTLVHAILQDYLLERLAGSPRSLDRLQAVAEEHFARATARGVVGRTVLWEAERAAIRRDLARFYGEEEGLEPLAAELAFGFDEPGGAPAVVVSLDDGRTVAFKGSADRVDRAPSGALVVSDYKTGAQRLLSDLIRDPVAGGRLLQLPVYALAARARFGNGALDSDSGNDAVRARYWLLSEQRSAPCYRLSVTDAVLARFRAVVGLIADALESGAFPGSPTGRTPDRMFAACRYCDFDRVCPPDRARQWARKRADEHLVTWRALAGATVPEGAEGLAAAGLLDERTVLEAITIDGGESSDDEPGGYEPGGERDVDDLDGGGSGEAP